MIISVDAHKNKIAVVWWYKDTKDEIYKLERADLIKGTQTEIKYWIIDRENWEYSTLVVIEKMQIYPNERVKDPNDLLEVSKVVGMCHFLGAKVVEYLPREWKGQLPKKTMHRRIKNALTELELSRLGTYTNQSDVLDAVGIGLKYLRRI